MKKNLKVWLLGLFFLSLGLAGWQWEKIKTERVINARTDAAFSCKYSEDNPFKCVNNTSATWGGQCVLYVCPSGVYDKDKCGSSDPGVQTTFGECYALINQTKPIDCWQVDAVANNVYCNVDSNNNGVKDGADCDSEQLNTNDCELLTEASPDPSPSPSPSPTPTPSPSPTPTPSPSVSPTPSPSPTPTPSPSPSVSPTPTPSPEPGKASFVIRKFKDSDKDGNWDNTETATGLSWHFQYRINSDSWQDYYTDSNSGWGGAISVGLGTKVEVREIEVSGWVNTTGVNKLNILDESKTYYYDFGNYPTPTLAQVSPPPQVPATGQTSHWWIFIGTAILGLGLQALALLL